MPNACDEAAVAFGRPKVNAPLARPEYALEGARWFLRVLALLILKPDDVPRMARLPDRFDLWVRQARACADPVRQADYVLGALASLPYWHLLNIGTRENPQPAEGEIDGNRYLLVFSDAAHVEDLTAGTEAMPPPISMPTIKAFPWTLERPGTAGLLVNPGEDAVLVPRDHLAQFHTEWLARQASQPAGFWIPNMTSEEEDFWQQHGL